MIHVSSHVSSVGYFKRNVTVESIISDRNYRSIYQICMPFVFVFFTSSRTYAIMPDLHKLN